MLLVVSAHNQRIFYTNKITAAPYDILLTDGRMYDIDKYDDDRW